MKKHFLFKHDSRPMDLLREAFPDLLCSSELDAGAKHPSMVWILADADHHATVMSECLSNHPLNKVVSISYAPNSLEALSVFKSGAKAYCHAMAPVSLLRQVGTVVESGGVWLGPEFMPHFLAGVSSLLPEVGNASGNQLLDKLTQRERDVALQVVKGVSNKAVARVLDITERTVKAHLTAIFEKLDVRDRVHMILMLKQAGEC